MLHRIQRDGQRQVGHLRLRPIHLAERHLEFFEVIVINALLQHARKDFVRQRILRQEAIYPNRLDPRQELPVSDIAGSQRGERYLIETVVVAIFAI